MTKKELTEQQKRFLEFLFSEECKGNLTKAKIAAGYSPDYPTRMVTNTLKDEIIEATRLYIATNAPRAAMAVIGGIEDPTELGLKEKLKAATDLLDRAGLIKTEKVEVTASGGVMVLPAKE